MHLLAMHRALYGVPADGWHSCPSTVWQSSEMRDMMQGRKLLDGLITRFTDRDYDRYNDRDDDRDNDRDEEEVRNCLRQCVHKDKRVVP